MLCYAAYIRVNPLDKQPRTALCNEWHDAVHRRNMSVCKPSKRGSRKRRTLVLLCCSTHKMTFWQCRLGGHGRCSLVRVVWLRTATEVKTGIRYRQFFFLIDLPVYSLTTCLRHSFKTRLAVCEWIYMKKLSKGTMGIWISQHMMLKPQKKTLRDR